MTNYPWEPSLELINGLVSKLYYLLQIMLFCSILQQPDNFFEKKTRLNLLLMTNYLCVPSLQLIDALVSKLYYLLQIMLFCSILQQPDNFFENETPLNLLLIINYPRVPSLEQINALVSKLYHLLQTMFFAAFCSNLIIFWRQNPLESTQNPKLLWNTKFGCNKARSSWFLRGGRFSPPLWVSGRSRRCGD